MKPWTVARHPRRWHYERSRRRLAEQTIAGTGLEIGALHSPFPVPRSATVRYVDRLTTGALRSEYPELADQALVTVDVVDDGETLHTIPDASQDFVIASHFLEHCEDPVGTLKAHLRVLRAGGTLLLAVPDRRFGVDRHRAPTGLDHIVRDHEEGPEVSRAEHYREWSTRVDLPLGNVAQGQIEAHAEVLRERNYSIHFHCWTHDEFSRQLDAVIQRYRLPAFAAAARSNHHEFLIALKRSS